MIFPAKFNNISILIFNSNYKKRLIGILKYIISEDKQYIEELKPTEEYFLSLLKPKRLDNNDPNNVIFTNRKQFESLCVTLLTNNIASPEKMTVLRFFTTLDHFEKKNKPKNENRRNKISSR